MYVERTREMLSREPEREAQPGRRLAAAPAADQGSGALGLGEIRARSRSFAATERSVAGRLAMARRARPGGGRWSGVYTRKERARTAPGIPEKLPRNAQGMAPSVRDRCVGAWHGFAVFKYTPHIHSERRVLTVPQHPAPLLVCAEQRRNNGHSSLLK